MRSHLQRVDLFQSEAPAKFLRDLVAQLARVYPKSLNEVSEYPREYQKYLRPHRLRTDAEMAFLTLASYHGLETCIQKNRSEDAHALVLLEHFLLTLSRTPSPLESPRWAQFRVDYSSRLNYRFQGEEFGEYPDPASVIIEEPRHYVVISHGPQDQKQGWSELGWVYANFVDEGRLGYTGPGIDLIAKFSPKSTETAIEGVQEPDFGPQDDREADNPGGE